MLSIPESARIFVARHAVDFRRQFDGLCAIAREQFDLDPFSGHVFVFFNKRRDRMKILVWQHTGFWLFYRRLEKGAFGPLFTAYDASECVEVEARRLRLLLDGIDLDATKFRREFTDPLRIHGWDDELDERRRRAADRRSRQDPAGSSPGAGAARGA